jgi:hypothetical protein
MIDISNFSKQRKVFFSSSKLLLGQDPSPFTTEVVAFLLPRAIAPSSWSSSTYSAPAPPSRTSSPRLCSCFPECSRHHDLGAARSSTSPQHFLVLICCDLIESKYILWDGICRKSASHCKFHPHQIPMQIPLWVSPVASPCDFFSVLPICW